MAHEETQRQDFREALQGQGVCSKWKTTKLILAIQRENGEKKLHKRIEIPTGMDKKLVLQVLITPSTLAAHKNSPELTLLTKVLSLALSRQLVPHDCCLIEAGFFTPQLQSVKAYTAAGVLLAQVVAVFNNSRAPTAYRRNSAVRHAKRWSGSGINLEITTVFRIFSYSSFSKKSETV